MLYFASFLLASKIMHSPARLILLVPWTLTTFSRLLSKVFACAQSSPEMGTPHHLRQSSSVLMLRRGWRIQDCGTGVGPSRKGSSQRQLEHAHVEFFSRFNVCSWSARLLRWPALSRAQPRGRDLDWQCRNPFHRVVLEARIEGGALPHQASNQDHLQPFCARKHRSRSMGTIPQIIMAISFQMIDSRRGPSQSSIRGRSFKKEL